MLRTAIATLLCVPALAFAADIVPEGRWEGAIRVPDRELRFVVDIARDLAGVWSGSITIPGIGVQGAALSPIIVSDAEIAFTIVNALGDATHGPATFSSKRVSTERIAGEMRQGGNAAEFVMQRTGSARVEPPRRSTRVSASVEDEWVGEYELGGYPRRVTIALQNRGDAGATAEFVVVGKQTTRLPVDFVGEDGAFVRVEAQTMGVTFEGHFDPQRGEIGGAITLGPVALPLTLRRRDKETVMRLAMLLAALLLVAAETDAQSMFRGDAAHTGVFRSEGPRQFHRVKWKFQTGDRVVSSPVIGEGVLYFGSDDGNVYAVDAANGSQVWKRATGDPVAATPAVAGGLVYVGSYDGRFYALDARTGATRWRFATAGERRFEAKHLHGLLPKHQTIADPFDVFLLSPVVAAGVVYFGSGDGNVYALDAATGELKWRFPTGDVVHASPAYANGVVYVGQLGQHFYAIDAATGKQKWRFDGGTDPVMHNQVGFQSSPAVVDGVVYTGCRDSNLYAIDAATGKEKWRFNNAGSWVITSPAVIDGKVVFGTSDTSRYFVVDATTGKELVRQQGKAFVFASPSVAGSVVFVGVLNGTLQARDLSSGELLWEFRTDAAKRNHGWVLTADGAFNVPLLYGNNWREAPLAASVRQFSVGSIFSSPLVVDGVVYVGSADGAVYALE